MICKRPFRKGVMEYGCGQCMPCRINKQRTWVGRLQLELATSELSSFVTLTYADEYLPHHGYLNKRDVQLWLKRLRKSLSKRGRTLRYFVCGEYGEQTWRPHYHAILYGVSPVESALLAESWAMGLVHAGTAEPASMSYVCGYVCKKMTNKKDPRLEGRPPEFVLMSKKPGIGLKSVDNIVSAYQSARGQAALKKEGWPSPTVRIGPKKYPMGRYLSRHVQDRLGLSDEDRKAHNFKMMVEAYKRKQGSTVEYERKRKAKVTQQEGRVKFKTAGWRRTI